MAKEFAENTTETSATINVCGQKGEVGYKTSTNYNKHYDYQKQESDNQTRIELKKKEVEIAKINAEKEVEIKRIEAEIVKTNAAKEVEMRRIEKYEKIETRKIEMEEKVRVAEFQAEICEQNQAKFDIEDTFKEAEKALSLTNEKVLDLGIEIYKLNQMKIEDKKTNAIELEIRRIEMKRRIESGGYIARYKNFYGL